MSKHETWRTRQYWESVGGLLIEEFVAVAKEPGQAQRLIDGVIVIDEKKGIAETNYLDIKGKNIISIQTKKGRLGMSVMGQAFFSRELLKQQKPKSVKSVIICGKDDAILHKLCMQHKLEVIIIPDELKKSK